MSDAPTGPIAAFMASAAMRLDRAISPAGKT